MKLSNCVKQFSTVGKWMAKAVFSLVAIAMFWQNAFLINPAAVAAPVPLLATSGADHVKGAADEVRDRSKDLIRDTKKNVEKTANRNAAKVDEQTDSGSYAERKAQRDKARIEQRAEDHSARTEKAVDDSTNAVKGIVDKVKDAFGG